MKKPTGQTDKAGHDGRQGAEAALKTLSARQEAILSTIPDMIMEVDNDKVYTWANQAGLDFFGENMIGQEAAYFFEREQDTDQYVQPVFAGDENVLYVESWHRRRDGQKRLLAWRCRTLKDEFGNVKGALSTAADITERRRAEEEVRTLNAELEQRVQVRTAELLAANKELEAFTYSVSHDLRAPLRAVDGFSRILLDEHAPQLSPEARRYLDLVRSNALQMGHLVDDLLAFSRFGRQAMMTEQVKPIALVREAWDLLRGERDGRPVKMTVGDLPSCHGDRVLLKQVFANLLSNALKFTRERDPAVIEVGCSRKDGENVFFVRDNGVGFDMRYAGKLFGVFQRLHRSEDYEGTGVGLAIVERIVHRHGGRVWAEAAPDKGATFFFSLGGK